MKLTGFYTEAGEKIAAGLLAGETLTVTRIAAGAGSTLLSAAALDLETQDLGLCTPQLDGNTAVLGCTLSAQQADEPYALTELGVYARSGDDAEVLYLVYRLDEPVSVDPEQRLVLRFNLEQTLSDGAGIEVTAPLNGLVTREELDGKADLVDGQLPYAQTPHLTSNVTLYVDAAAGDDSNPGTQSEPFKTIQAAVNSIPKDLGGFIATINVAEGEYLEDVVISGFHNSEFNNGIYLIGSGSEINTTRHLNTLFIHNNSAPVRVSGFYVTGNNSGYSVCSTNSVFVTLIALKISFTAASAAGLCVGGWGAAAAALNGVQVDGYTSGITILNSSVVSANNCSVSNCQTGVQVGTSSSGTTGILLIARSFTFSGNTVDTQTYGGSQIFGG